MTPRELERLEKDSIYSLKINNDLKDQVVNGYVNGLSKVVRNEVKKRKIMIVILATD